MKLMKAINIAFFIMLWIITTIIFAKTDPNASSGLIVTTLISTLILYMIFAFLIERRADKYIKKQLERKIDNAVIDALYRHKEKVYNRLNANPDTYKIMMTNIPIRNSLGKEIGEETFGGKLNEISGKIIRNS